jgi:hypothetical protein
VNPSSAVRENADGVSHNPAELHHAGISSLFSPEPIEHVRHEHAFHEFATSIPHVAFHDPTIVSVP